MKGGEITFGQLGAGSFVRRDDIPKRIVLDPSGKDNPTSIIQSLAHETGHALHKYDPDYSSIQACVDSYLSDEGAATLKNVEIQREILANGGPDIGIAGNASNHAAYSTAYDEFLKNNNTNAARKAIGNIFGSGERASTTNQSYADYYRGYCKNAAAR